jgi:hypothetical protein
LYGWFWDTVSLLGFGLAAVSMLGAHKDALTWREVAASLLCVVQGFLYFFVIARGGWPLTRARLTLYFVCGPLLWLGTSWLNPFVWWLGFTYFGQMLGLLPPQATIPGTASGRFQQFPLALLWASHFNGSVQRRSTFSFTASPAQAENEQS